MRTGKQVLLAWVAVETLYLVSLVALPVARFDWTAFANYSSQTLLALISLSLALREPVRKNRLIFANFAAVFSVALLVHASSFVGTVIPGELIFPSASYALMLLDQYVFRGAYFFLLASAIVYLTMDVLFRGMRTIPKYGLTLLIVGSFYAYYYLPFFEDPLYLHNTVAVQEWKGLDKLFFSFNEEHGRAPSEEELAGLAAAAGWLPTSGPWLDKIEEYYPYLFGNNYQILVYKPLVMNQIYMSVLCIAFIFLFFGYQILRDPPQGAYIEKVVFSLLLFVSLEVYHSWMWLDSLNWPAFNAMYTVGQYVTIAVLLMIAGFFGLRLRFLNSANGDFYENELAMSPGSITRWRDVLDNLVIERFFNRRVLLGRLLVDPSRK